MDISDAVYTLRRAYNDAPYRRQATSLHLFGIKYAKVLALIQRKHGLSRNELLKMLVSQADISDSYTTEINKGINLADFVDVKTSRLWF